MIISCRDNDKFISPCLQKSIVTLVPKPNFAGGGEGRPGTHCLRMRVNFPTFLEFRATNGRREAFEFAVQRLHYFFLEHTQVNTIPSAKSQTGRKPTRSHGRILLDSTRQNRKTARLEATLDLHRGHLHYSMPLFFLFAAPTLNYSVLF